MKALLLIAHGSRSQDANNEIRELTSALKILLENNSEEPHKMVNCAFLELAEPDIASGIKNLAQAGATEITVLPYFLAKGNHIVRDLPEKLANAKIAFPDLTVRTVPYIGDSKNMVKLLLDHVNRNIA